MKLHFSGMARAEACPPSFVLPWSHSTGAPAGHGLVVHAYLEDVSNLGVEAALERVPAEHRPACEVINLAELPASKPGTYAAEVAFAYDVDNGTAREIGRGIDRAYEGKVGPREIPGTLDVVGVGEDVVIVSDYKTGHANLGPAKDNWQLRIGALAAARAYGKARAIVSIIRIPEDGEPIWQRAELSEMDLDATEVEIRDLVFRVELAENEVAEGEQPITAEGAHCRYCPAFTSCPAKMNLAREVLGQSRALAPPVLTAENAPTLYAKLKAAEAVIASVWSTLETFARAAPIPLPGGEVFGEVVTERDKLKAGAVRVALEKRFGLEVAAKLEIKESLTKEALKDALRGHVKNTPGVKITKLFDTTVEALREAGAIITTTTTTVLAHKPKPAALPAVTAEVAP